MEDKMKWIPDWLDEAFHVVAMHISFAFGAMWYGFLWCLSKVLVLVVLIVFASVARADTMPGPIPGSIITSQIFSTPAQNEDGGGFVITNFIFPGGSGTMEETDEYNGAWGDIVFNSPVSQLSFGWMTTESFSATITGPGGTDSLTAIDSPGQGESQTFNFLITEINWNAWDLGEIDSLDPVDTPEPSTYALLLLALDLMLVAYWPRRRHA
jgi:hypothetical protein